MFLSPVPPLWGKKSIDSGSTVGHQQQAVREDIPRIGFPKGVEQETAQYVMSFLMAFFLYEKGFREMDFNFSWGYMYGIFFAFVGALLVLLRATANADTRKRKIVVAVQWLAYLWHLVCGMYYFGGFLQGAMYY